MDFVPDNLFNGRRFRALTVVDNFSRECLAIHAGKSLKGEDVARIMEALRVPDKRLPVRIQTDNGSEFISKSLDGRMNTASQWTSRAPESRQITRLLNHLMAVWG
ncbi:Transposase [Salmonella enterica subsp. enterica serovar Urbana str. R8-2977]|nr:Transposase [Salmonella enterica subsp. enterica serovar Urbana str. R8-2977]ESE99548.1 hypothetical protein SEEU9261_19903 [Salmonella enterica subsp. enterica serovar Urbana str. ATCC 9261]